MLSVASKLYVVGLWGYQLGAKFDFVTLGLSRPWNFEGAFETQVYTFDLPFQKSAVGFSLFVTSTLFFL